MVPRPSWEAETRLFAALDGLAEEETLLLGDICAAANGPTLAETWDPAAEVPPR